MLRVLKFISNNRYCISTIRILITSQQFDCGNFTENGVVLPESGTESESNVNRFEKVTRRKFL